MGTPPVALHVTCCFREVMRSGGSRRRRRVLWVRSCGGEVESGGEELQGGVPTEAEIGRAHV